MDKNQKIAVGVIVLIALIAAWQLGKQPSGQNQNENQNTQIQAENSGEKTEPSKPTATPKPQTQTTTQGDVWEGTLLESDNTNKGNYRLVTKDHILYLRTSRDFSSLINKQVRVSYQGTVDSFILGDINVVAK
jgi:hypothetical protein